jgi:redox-sensing transcriptional repressor
MLSTPTCERLVRYLRLLKDGGDRTVTSAELATALDVDSSLVRKDLAAVGLRGRPCKGFSSAVICSRLRDFLGVEQRWKAVILGAGRLGTAIACHREFQGMGLDVTGLFDRDPAKIGQMAGGNPILPVEMLELHIQTERVQLAILTVPGDSAQVLAERLARAGIRAIWNFSPCRLSISSKVLVRHEHLVVGLGTVLCGLSHSQRWVAKAGR